MKRRRRPIALALLFILSPSSAQTVRGGSLADGGSSDASTPGSPSRSPVSASANSESSVSGVNSAAPPRPPGLDVAILGDSRTDGCVGQPSRRACRKADLGFEKETLSALLGWAAQKRPAAVFFTGDLTLGLEKEDEDGAIDPGASPAAGGWSRDFQYEPKTFSRMLSAFKKTVQQQLGATPFYPVVGNHDTVGPDAITQFRRAFGLEHPPGGYREPAHLAYTIVVGNAAFVVLATNYYQSCAESSSRGPACNLQEHLVSQPQLAWLDEQLAKHAGKQLFVLGHEPAFSSGKQKTGLDFNEGARDAFWKILKGRGVTAYLCSHQHQFDLSQHDGVWQVLSGGAGARLDGALKNSQGAPASDCTGGLKLMPGFAERSFFHYLLLHLPDSPQAAPSIEVHDCTDRLRRQFELTPPPAPPPNGPATPRPRPQPPQN